MTDRRRIFLPILIALAHINLGFGAMAQTTSYDLPLTGRVVDVDVSNLGDDQNSDLLSALQRRQDLASDQPGMDQADGFALVMADSESAVLRIRIRFASLPQRAMAPVLIANGEIIGHAVGAFDEVDGGVEAEFLVVPRLAGALALDADGPIELAVQMGEDTRTKSTLRSEETLEAVRAALRR